MVEFIGARLPVKDCVSYDHKIVDMCWDYESKIIKDLDPSVVIAYITGNFGNVVIKDRNTSHFKASGNGGSTHKIATSIIAPHYYSTVRIHQMLYNTHQDSFAVDGTLFLQYYNLDDHLDIPSSVDCPPFINDNEEKKKGALRYRYQWNTK
jgi:hypothetical protein